MIETPHLKNVVVLSICAVKKNFQLRVTLELALNAGKGHIA